jgi:hypothetical protein
MNDRRWFFGWEKGERSGREKKIVKKRWQGSKLNKGGRKKRGEESNRKEGSKRKVEWDLKEGKKEVKYGGRE